MLVNVKADFCLFALICPVPNPWQYWIAAPHCICILPVPLPRLHSHKDDEKPTS